jgi:hypothetical protein
MEAISEACGKQRMPQVQLRLGVLATNAGHHSAALRCGRKIHEQMVRCAVRDLLVIKVTGSYASDDVVCGIKLCCTYGNDTRRACGKSCYP